MDLFLGWMFGPLEITLVVLASLLLFGRRLPEIARSLGKGITEFRKGVKDVGNEVDKAAEVSNTSADAGPSADVDKEKPSEG